jgi:hypothetical protein
VDLEELTRLVNDPREAETVELKDGGRLVRINTPLVGKVLRPMLAMANHGGGGEIVLGIREHNGEFAAMGMDRADANSWRFDSLADRIAEYADPSVDFDVRMQEIAERWYVNIVVAEFRDLPVIARRDFNDTSNTTIIQRGTIYVRSRRKPESVPVPGSVEMRDVFNLLVEKGLRREIDKLKRLDLWRELAPLRDDEARFGEQRGDL